jgi:predicted membrane-bound spermidine synthase
MKRKKSLRKYLGAGVAIPLVAVILIVLLAGCESIFGPKTEESTDEEENEARIIVYNTYGETLDIYMDGKFQFTVEEDDDKKIRDVELDEHDLEAKLAGTGTVVDDETMDVTSYTDYSWTIDDAPDIVITNNYGTALKIYMDGDYQFNLAYKESRWIMDLTKTEHFLKARRVDNDKEVASVTIDVDENKDYAWTID